MSLVINTNVASLNAQRSLANTQGALAKNLAHLSSGMRISSASDDAAGLAISENLKAQIRSTSQAERNANDGVSLSQVTEGALEQMGNVLSRMRELAVEASNGTIDSNSGGYINNEFNALKNEVDRISGVTSFNGTHVLDATAVTVSLQVGINKSANDNISVVLSQVDTTTIGSGGGSVIFLTAASLSTQANAQIAISTIDQAINQVSASRAAQGAYQNRLAVAVSNMQTMSENFSAANSRIRDVDVASETAALTRNQILSQAGVAVLAQANQLPSAALSLLK